jgi:hypothetical protein
MNKNLAASVRARLLNVAKAQGADFNKGGSYTLRKIGSMSENGIHISDIDMAWNAGKSVTQAGRKTFHRLKQQTERLTF